MPKVSVLVPIFNAEPFLRECLDSAVGQTLGDIEIICINDGSTDESLKIVEEYAARDSRIVIIDKSNSGYGDSMNQGLAKANGEYIGIVESDDRADADMFEKLYELAKDNDADLVKSNYFDYFTSEDKNAISGRLAHIVDPGLTGRVLKPQDYPHIFLSRPAIWSGLFRKDFLRTHGIDFLPTPGASFQDTAFQFKTWAMAERAILTSQGFLHYRQDNEASSINNPGKTFCVGDEYEEIKRYLKEKDLFEDLKAIYQVARWGGYRWNIQRLAIPLADEFIDYASTQLRQEEGAGDLSTRLCEPDQHRWIRDLLERPDWVKKQRAAQEAAKISVIMPVHNVEDYLREAIDSVLGQSLTDFELLIVDDGSVDASIEILEEYHYADPRVNLFSRHCEGQSVARNIALDNATADYVAFIDGDDYYEPHALESLYEAAIKDDLDLVVGSANVLFETGTRTAIERAHDKNYYLVPDAGRREMSPATLNKIDVCLWNKIYRRDLIDNNGIRFPAGLKYEDAYFLNAYAWLCEEMAFLPPELIVYNYRRRRGSTMDISYVTGKYSLDHMEVAFLLLPVLEEYRLQEKYGLYYMRLLYRYLEISFQLAPETQYDHARKKLCRWLSANYADLEKLDTKALADVLETIPPEYLSKVEGNRVVATRERVQRKVKKGIKKAMWSLLPSYRAASNVNRNVHQLEVRLDSFLHVVSRQSEAISRSIEASKRKK